jgi:hypothetical protein
MCLSGRPGSSELRERPRRATGVARFALHYLARRRDPDFAVYRHRHYGVSRRAFRALPYVLAPAMKGLVPDLEMMAQEHMRPKMEQMGTRSRKPVKCLN